MKKVGHILLRAQPHIKHKEDGYFPTLSPSSQLNSRADLLIFFSHWGCSRLPWKAGWSLPCPVRHMASGWLSNPRGTAAIPAFQTSVWAAPIGRLWMTQMCFISRCWIFPFHFPGRGKRLIYSLCWGGRGQKQTVKRNSIFSDIIQILRLNTCNLPFQDFSPLMSDILICIQLQIKWAPFNFLRELWQADMWDVPSSFMINW